MEQKKLYRSTRDRKIAGVCGGIADYINIDVTVVRVLFVIFGFVGCGLLAYIVLALVVPSEYEIQHNNQYNQNFQNNNQNYQSNNQNDYQNNNQN